jgi:uncharacterized membrane protein HdeD (DUF308 family)
MNDSQSERGDLAVEHQHLSSTNIGAHRLWFTVLGGVLVALGAIAIVAAFAATLATVLLFGVLLLMGGVAQIFHAFSARRWRGFTLHLLVGILYATVGVLILIDPVAGAIGLTLLLAAFFIGLGCLKVILAVQAESGWFGLSGALDLLLGILVLVGWPQTGVWVIGLFVGIELVFAGLSLLLLAFASRPAAHAELP